MDDFDVLGGAVARVREAHRVVKEDRDRLSAVLSAERQASAELDRRRGMLLAHEEQRRASAEGVAASLEDDLARLRAECDALRQRPVALEAAEQAVAGLEAELGMSRRESERLAAENTGLRDALGVAEGVGQAAAQEAQQATVKAEHALRRERERTNDRIERIAAENATLRKQLQAAQQEVERARSAMLDHAART